MNPIFYHYLKSRLQTTLKWQYNEFSLDVNVKLFYIGRVYPLNIMRQKTGQDIPRFEEPGNKEFATSSGDWEDEEGFSFTIPVATTLSLGAAGAGGSCRTNLQYQEQKITILSINMKINRKTTFILKLHRMDYLQPLLQEA